MKLASMNRIQSLVAILALCSSAVPAFACADGPDEYSVYGVASNDVLNVRSGPGLGFGIVGKLPHNATGLANLDQVPIVCDDISQLNAFERKNFWTKINWRGNGRFVVGWVKTRFLSE